MFGFGGELHFSKISIQITNPTEWLFSSILLISCLTSALGPPKIELQNNNEVWFQGKYDAKTSNKFTLKCQASGNPETFTWYKNGEELEIDGERIIWQKPSQSGNIIFTNARSTDQGYYQCFISNLFGTAVSNKIHVRLGVLEHFTTRAPRRLIAEEGKSLSIPCNAPHGVPPPSVFWLYRDAIQTSVIETIRRKHIAVDEKGTLHFSAVEKHDGRLNLIYQCAVTSPVLQGEYRAGDEFRLIVEPAKNEEWPVHKLWFSPEEVSVKAGTKLKLICIFGGKPVPTVIWSKVDGELPVKRIYDLTSSESDYGKSLIIDNIHPEDAGTYECRSEHLFHQMRVTVIASPYWLYEPPMDIDQVEDSTAEINCLVSGTPAPIIQWFMNGRPLYEVPQNERRLILDNGRILRISKLDHDVDTAVYQCNASNPFGYTFGNAYVNVRAYEPRFKMPDRRIWNVVRKSSVDMSCEVDAAPEAVVRWVDVNDQSIAIIPGKLQLFKNHTLRIIQVNSADEGLYYCNVSNKYGINRAYNKLQVFNPTHFVRVPGPTKMVVEAHEEFELFCKAVSDPRLQIEYKWTHNGVLLNESEHFRFKNFSLVIKNVRGWHSGAIDCVVITDVDVKTSGIDLTVLDVPAAPKDIQIDCNERRATVQWRKPEDHGDRITKFLVQMSTSFEEGKWETVFEEIKTTMDFYKTQITLSPWVNYTFRVIAKNSHGEGEAGYNQKAICVTKESFPYSNPSNVRAEGTEPDNLLIYWKPMDKYDWNGPDLQYIVRYRLNEPGAKWEELLIEDPLANHTVIREQPTFREYSVQVRAMNKVGNSIVEPISAIGFSGEDVPTESPKNFKIVEFFNFSSAALEWQHVERNSVRGHFKGYLIEYWQKKNSQFPEKFLVPNDKNFAVLTGLKPITNYTAKIHTVNNHYMSESPSTIEFLTPEGLPSKVHNIRVRAVGSFSILITWEKPRQPNGNIRGYFISFENPMSGSIEETYVLNRQTHYLHEEGEPDTGYKVSVWAETNGGEGPKVIRAVRTWSLKDLDPPIMKTESTSPTTIKIQWIPSNGTEWGMPGPTFYVNYTVSDREEWYHSEYISLPSSEIILRDLNEDTLYKIIGVSRERDRRMFSEPIFVRTLPRATITHLSQESLHSAAWFIAILCALLLAVTTALIMCCCQRNRGGKYAVKRRELERGHHMNAEEHQISDISWNINTDSSRAVIFSKSGLHESGIYGAPSFI